jgi:amino acid transporter
VSEVVNTTLRKNALGVGAVVFLVLAAVAPLTGMVVVAALAIAFGNGGGTPFSFLAVAAILLLFAIGYGQMSSELVNAGGFYAFVVKGLGRRPGWPPATSRRWATTSSWSARSARAASS